MAYGDSKTVPERRHCFGSFLLKFCPMRQVSLKDVLIKVAAIRIKCSSSGSWLYNLTHGQSDATESVLDLFQNQIPK